jgi:hypothetical protein
MMYWLIAAAFIGALVVIAHLVIKIRNLKDELSCERHRRSMANNDLNEAYEALAAKEKRKERK